jgi:hypothetical protein
MSALTSVRSLRITVLALGLVPMAVAGCDPLGLDDLSYTYNGTTYDSSEQALAAQRRDDDALVAAIARRDQPMAAKATILVPSKSHLIDLTLATRCAAYFCRSSSAVYWEKEHNAASWHEDLLSTVRSIERSNLFRTVEIEEYDTIDRARIDAAGDLVIAVHGAELGHKEGGWYLYSRHVPAGEYLPFARAIEPRSKRMNAWLNALEERARRSLEAGAG